MCVVSPCLSVTAELIQTRQQLSPLAEKYWIDNWAGFWAHYTRTWWRLLREIPFCRRWVMGNSKKPD